MLSASTRLLLVAELILSLLTAQFSEAAPVLRCQNLIPEVRVRHSSVFGVDFPYHYAVGQLQQESNCRNIISNDGVGSQGVSQVTWSVWKELLAKNGISDLSSTSDQIKSQALINYEAYKQSKKSKLWISYQIYNGGGLVLKELKSAQPIEKNFHFSEWYAAKEKCKRKIVEFSSGQRINACDINYDYGVKLFEYGKQYQIFKDSEKFPYW